MEMVVAMAMCSRSSVHRRRDQTFFLCGYWAMNARYVASPSSAGLLSKIIPAETDFNVATKD